MSISKEHREAIAVRREDVAELVGLKMSATEIAHRLDVTVRTVNRDMEELRLNRPPARRTTPEQIATARRLLVEGATYPEAARTVGCRARVLRNRLPGFALTPQETAQHAAMGRMMARIERKSA